MKYPGSFKILARTSGTCSSNLANLPGSGSLPEERFESSEVAIAKSNWSSFSLGQKSLKTTLKSFPNDRVSTKPNDPVGRTLQTPARRCPRSPSTLRLRNLNWENLAFGWVSSRAHVDLGVCHYVTSLCHILIQFMLFLELVVLDQRYLKPRFWKRSQGWLMMKTFKIHQNA